MSIVLYSVWEELGAEVWGSVYVRKGRDRSVAFVFNM